MSSTISHDSISEALRAEMSEVFDDDDDLDEITYVPPPLTIQGINEMNKKTLLTACAFYNINTSQPLKKLRAQLKTKV